MSCCITFSKKKEIFVEMFFRGKKFPLREKYQPTCLGEGYICTLNFKEGKYSSNENCFSPDGVHGRGIPQN